MGKENLRVKNAGTKYYIEVLGDLDEDANFFDPHLDGATEIVVNFEGVSRIQSCGIREWIQMLNPYKMLPYTFINCPKIIVDQINMLEGFLPKKGKVESFYVPYYSQEAGTEKQVLFTLGKEFDQNGIYPPEEVRDDSGNLMEMDVVELKYFKFLQKL